MVKMRKAGWFVAMTIILAGWIGVLGALHGTAEAGVVGSIVPQESASAEDLAAIQSFLESKVVAQRLIDYGVSPEEAMTKVREMNPRELHQLASLTDRAAEGTGVAGVLIGVVVVAIIILVVLVMFDKEVIIR